MGTLNFTFAQIDAAIAAMLATTGGLPGASVSDYVGAAYNIITEALASAVNITMQAEAKSEHWPQWSWRPFWGFSSALAFLFVAGLCCVLAYQAILGGRPESIAMIPQLVAAFATLFTIPGAILGVTAWHRGKEKRGI